MPAINLPQHPVRSDRARLGDCGHAGCVSRIRAEPAQPARCRGDPADGRSVCRCGAPPHSSGARASRRDFHLQYLQRRRDCRRARLSRQLASGICRARGLRLLRRLLHRISRVALGRCGATLPLGDATHDAARWWATTAAFAEYGPEYNSLCPHDRTVRAQLSRRSGAAKAISADWWMGSQRRHGVVSCVEAPRRFRRPEDRALLSASQESGKRRQRRLFSNGAAQAGPTHVLVVASLPANQHADALILRSGQADVILRKTDPRLIPSSACAGLCFTGLVAASGLPADIAANLSAVNLRGPNSVSRIPKSPACGRQHRAWRPCC